jgi:3-oxoacyl-[acyl-carrier-protein] synthase III
MAFVETKNIQIRGVAAAVPVQKLSTHSYTELSSEERVLFSKTTGIKERRVAPAHLATSDLCIEPARQLLKHLNWQPTDVDVVIVVTQSPDHFIPCSAVIVQHQLGLRKDIPAFDINLGCSGYVYGLYVLSSLLTGGQLKRGLLLAGDKSTSSTAYTDKSTFPLFGDAGSATAVEYAENSPSLFFQLSSDGSGKEAIMVEDGGSRNGLKEDTFAMKEIQPGIVRSKRHLKLDGIEIFNFALREVAPALNALFSFAQRSVESTDYFVFHQANKLINESVRKKLKISAAEKVPYSLENFGNTSSASIPLTMVTQLQNVLSAQSLQLCLSGFGVGFSWAGCLLTTQQIACVPLIELP